MATMVEETVFRMVYMFCSCPLYWKAQSAAHSYIVSKHTTPMEVKRALFLAYVGSVDAYYGLAHALEALLAETACVQIMGCERSLSWSYTGKFDNPTDFIS